MESEQSPPSKKMLPPFRVRSARLPEADGTIRIKKDEYDALLLRLPRAALRYIDESDGEVILVGSALELDQKLAETVANAAKVIAGVPLDLYGTGKTPMHTFDIVKDEDVVKTWQDLDLRTSEEGEKAKKLFFGKKSATYKPSSSPCEAGRLDVSMNAPVVPPKLEAAPSKETGNADAKVRFGEASPPRSSRIEKQRAPEQNTPQVNRWASYGSLPDRLTAGPRSVPASTSAVEEKVIPASKDVSAHSQESAAAQSAALGTGSVLCSTLQVVSTPQQKQEHKPLVDMFWEEARKDELTCSGASTGAYNPLLAMYEKDLRELGTTSSTIRNKPEKLQDVEMTGKPALRLNQASSHPLTGAEAEAARSGRLQKPTELLTQSLQTLLQGVGKLASAFHLTNAELQQQIALVQSHAPHNIERALEKSIAAVEKLKTMVPTDRIVAMARQSPPSSPTEPQVTACDSTSGAEAQCVSGNALPGIQTEIEKAGEQSTRVERAVEEMRLILLNDLKWSPGKIYTRADVLEDFLKHFQKLQSGKLGTQVPRMSDEARRTRSNPTENNPWATDIEFKVDEPHDEGIPVFVENNHGSAASDARRISSQSHPVLAKNNNPDTANTRTRNSVDHWEAEVNDWGKMRQTREAGPASALAPGSWARQCHQCQVCSQMFYDPEMLKLHIKMTHGQHLKSNPTLPRPSYTYQPLVGDLYSRTTQRLSSQSSMPILRAHNVDGATVYEAPVIAAKRDHDQVVEPLGMRPMRSTGVLRSASTTIARRPSRTMDKGDFAGPERSHAVDGTAQKVAPRMEEVSDLDEARIRARVAKLTGGVYKSTASPSGPIQLEGVTPSVSRVDACSRRLVEMGFERSRAETVADAVMGDLESAVDALEEDESARRQVKGKQRAVPGAFDEELYG